MKTIKYQILFCSLLCVNMIFGQNLKYGFSYGKGTSFQKWDYVNPDLAWASHTKEEKSSFEIYGILEKQFNKYIALKTELGYQQKGFTQKFFDIAFASGHQVTEDVGTNNLAINIIGKIGLPIKFLNIYAFSGLNTNYLISVNDWELIFYNKKINNYHEYYFNQYKSLVFSGIIGAGIEINKIMCIEYRNNFPFMSSTKGDIKIKDSFSGLTLGVYLNRLFEKESTSI